MTGGRSCILDRGRVVTLHRVEMGCRLICQKENAVILSWFCAFCLSCRGKKNSRDLVETCLQQQKKRIKKKSIFWCVRPWDGDEGPLGWVCWVYTVYRCYLSCLLFGRFMKVWKFCSISERWAFCSIFFWREYTSSSATYFACYHIFLSFYA